VETATPKDDTSCLISECKQLQQYARKRKRVDSVNQPTTTPAVAQTSTIPTTTTVSAAPIGQPASTLYVLKAHMKTIKDEMKQVGTILGSTPLTKGALEWLKQDLKSVRTILIDIDEKLQQQQQ
jgi:hypothetical protein